MFFKLFNNYLRPPVLLLGLAEAGVIFGAVFVAVALHWQQEQDAPSSSGRPPSGRRRRS